MTGKNETLRVRYTRGDHATNPGGVVLRRFVDGSYATHLFNRQYGSREPEGFYWGHYFGADREAEARADFDERVSDAAKYTAGGSLIPELAVEVELAHEARPAELLCGHCGEPLPLGITPPGQPDCPACGRNN